MPIQKSTAKNFVVVNTEISKKNFVAVDSEFSSQTMPLSIQKSTAKNFVVGDSKIDSKTTTLPIQKLATKNCVAVDLEWQQWWSHFGFTFFFLEFIATAVEKDLHPRNERSSCAEIHG